MVNLNGQTMTNGQLLVSGAGVLTNSGAGATVNGGVSNAATISVTANTFFNGVVTNTGAMFFEGAISNNYVQTAGTNFLNGSATITQNATVNGGLFNLNGQTYSNGLMIVSGTGVVTNGTAGATVNGGVSNANVIAVTATTYFKGPVTNTGAMFFQGAISNGLVNSGSFNLNSSATLTVAPANNGTINVAASTLTVNPSWANSGTILIANGTVAGGSLTNNSGATVSGAGTIAPLLVNNGLLVVTNGTLTLTVAPQQNGLVNVADGGGPGTLSVTPAWNNSGTVSIAGRRCHRWQFHQLVQRHGDQPGRDQRIIGQSGQRGAGRLGQQLPADQRDEHRQQQGDCDRCRHDQRRLVRPEWRHVFQRPDGAQRNRCADGQRGQRDVQRRVEQRRHRLFDAGCDLQRPGHQHGHIYVAGRHQ